MNYADYKKLIFKISWSIKKNHRFIEIDDLIGEGNLIYMKCLKTFDEKRNIKFSTYLTSSLNHGLISYCKKQKQFQDEMLDDSLFQKQNFTFFEISDASKEVLEIIKTNPIKEKITKQKLTKYLFNTMNFNHKEIKSSFAEIKTALCEI